MPVITCPTCGTKLEVDADQVGRSVQCGSCQQVFEANTDAGAGRSRNSRFGRDEDEDDDRPSRRRKSKYRREYDDEDDRPSRRGRRRDDDDEDDYRPSRRKPSQIQSIGVMLLIGGIMAVLTSLGLGVGSTGLCCLWPGTYYELVYGILAIVRGSQMMGANDPADPPRGTLIMAIITIVNLDVLNLILGIVGLSMLNAPEVADYYARRR